MIKHETKFSLIFRSWWRSTRMPGWFELKDTRGKLNLPYDEVKEAQIDAAEATMSPRGNLVRVQSGTTGTADYLGLVSMPCYVVVRYPGFFAVIDYKDFLAERKRSDAASLSTVRAKAIASVTVPLST